MTAARTRAPARRSGPGPRFVRMRWVLAALSVGACGSGPEEAFTVADSAGVVVAESSAPWWDGEAPWRIDPEPGRVIGSADAEGPTSFGRVVDVAMLGGDRIAVADEMAGEIRVFSLDGAHEVTIGRQGRGPGEFERLSSIQYLGGDSLAAFDRAVRRLSVFRLSGELLGTRDLGSLELDGELAFPADPLVLSDGTLAFRDGRDFSGEGLGTSRDTVHFMAIVPGSARPAAIEAVPGMWTLRTAYEGRTLFLFQPFTPMPAWTVWRDTLFILAGEWREVRKASVAGLESILRRSGSPRTLTEADADLMVEQTLARVPEAEKAEAERIFRGMELPRRVPAYADVFVDPDGHAWAERYESPGHVPARAFDVFGPGGRWLGAVENAPGLDVFEVGRDYVLGVRLDELDVPRVALHALERGG